MITETSGSFAGRISGQRRGMSLRLTTVRISAITQARRMSSVRRGNTSKTMLLRDRATAKPLRRPRLPLRFDRVRRVGELGHDAAIGFLRLLAVALHVP